MMTHRLADRTKPMKQILISGYGSAGRRHHRALMEHGHHIEVYDPDQSVLPSGAVGYKDWPKALLAGPWDLVVIASPPSEHLEQIYDALACGIPVLCEKPLCDLGQLERAAEVVGRADPDRVMVTFNYRYNAAFWPKKHIPIYDDEFPRWEHTAQQHRSEKPSWGYLLDHVSHNLDILYWQAGDLKIGYAKHSDNKEYEEWLVGGVTGIGYPFMTRDRIYHGPIRQNLRLRSPEWRIWAGNPDLKMFDRMYQHMYKWLDGSEPPYPDIIDAYRIQVYLQKTSDLCNGER